MPNALTRLLDKTGLTAEARFKAKVRQEQVQIEQGKWDPPPPAPALISKDGGKAIWEVEIPGQAPKYMASQQGMAEKYIVHVDAERFYKAWLNTPLRDGLAFGPEAQCRLRSEMPKDRKYTWAEKGFEEGKSNPVPLANPRVRSDEPGKEKITFEDGVTRTYWLLANKAPSFPVETSSERDALALHRIAGLGHGPHKLSEILAAQQKREPPTQRQALEKTQTIKPPTRKRRGPAL